MRRKLQSKLAYAWLCVCAFLVLLLCFALLVLFVSCVPELLVNRDTLSAASVSDALGRAFTSLCLALGSVLLCAPFAAACAMLLQNRRSRLHNAAIVAVQTHAGMPSILFGLLSAFVLIPFFAKISPVFARLGMVISLSFMAMPSLVISWTQSLAAIPAGTLMASAALGATPTQTLFYDVFPAAWRNLTSGCVLAFGRVLGETAAIAVVVRVLAGIPGVDLETLSLHIFRNTTLLNGVSAWDGALWLELTMLMLLSVVCIIAARCLEKEIEP